MILLGRLGSVLSGKRRAVVIAPAASAIRAAAVNNVLKVDKVGILVLFGVMW